SITDPTGSNSGSAATTPVCAATPAVVTIPLQYALALKARREPGSGSAYASCSVARRATYFESSARTSYIDTKPHAAIPVTIVRRQKRSEMIMARQKGGGQKGRNSRSAFYLPALLISCGG